MHTLEVGGPQQGPVAFGLAVGAQLFVQNGYFWNALAFHGSGYLGEKELLERWWGVTDRGGWLRTQERLLCADMVSDVWEFVLSLRHSLARDYAGPVPGDLWREAAARALRLRAAGADGVAHGHVTSTTVLGSRISGAQRLIGRILRYEARFRADGLLPEGAYVRTVEAWDHGRASAMARWGLAARYCTLSEAETAVLRAGRQVRANYRSWADFSAAYALGRCLHFDEEEFGTWYEKSLRTHHVLMSAPASPWLTIPWT